MSGESAALAASQMAQKAAVVDQGCLLECLLQVVAVEPECLLQVAGVEPVCLLQEVVVDQGCRPASRLRLLHSMMRPMAGQMV